MKTIFQFLFALCGAGLMCVPNGGAQSTNYMVLHNLTGNDGDGATPYARLTECSMARLRLGAARATVRCSN